MKDKLLTELGFHKRRAKTFFNLLKTQKVDEYTMSFDCQKNLLLPKLPDQAAYYSRQCYMFNFTICVGTSKDIQCKENTFIYCWTEIDGFKGSNEISSCVHHQLCNTVFPTNVHTIRIFADGCGGQNKNQTMLGMLSKWLKDEAPMQINTVKVIFPVPGHSYIPPDRVFGRIEKVVRRREVIVDPDEYIGIFENYGTVVRPQGFFDWKKSVCEVLKPPANWHFKFAPTKRFILHKNKTVSIQGETTYITDIGASKSVCRKGKNISQMVPAPITLGVTPKPAKVTDVMNLIGKHYGDGWQTIPSLMFYKRLSLNITIEHQDEEEEDSQMADNDLIL